MKPDVLALAAIFMWATLAPLGVRLAHVPAFLLTGLALLVGSLIALPLSGFQLARWRVPARTLALGVYGLFGFHFLLFLALRHAPAVQANLVNYLWPLGMVVLAPALLPGVRLRWQHVAAALLGFAGAAVAILGGKEATARFEWGYLLALASAFVWASFSLWTRRVAPYPTAAVGSFAAVSGVLALLCHALLEPAVSLSTSDLLLIAALGLGPLGSAFFCWDAALKDGDPRRIGLLAFITPVLSTLMLLLSTGRPFHWSLGLAIAMVVGAAVWGSRSG
jgi:drug/metabolite transporter (DMT)-like permease